jgi:putative intracellular protease/amidase/catechol 2,3-dioxygenase-like lactoylglutathione lyase family enzyme
MTRTLSTPQETNMSNRPSKDSRPPRRRLLSSAVLGGIAASCATSPVEQRTTPVSAVAPRSATLGARLQGVQHFGLTVQNMERAFEFYTAVLGGTEVMRDGDFHGERIHNTLLTDQDLEAGKRQVNPRTMAVPDLRSGAQRLDVRFIQFDNAVIELLQYRDATQPSGTGAAFAGPIDHMSPAIPRMMHICFHIRDDVDFDQFIADLEAESSRRGMTQVRANRVVTVRTEQERLAAPRHANSNAITEGKSNGWRLIYCTGSEGEQLEFVQALGPVKKVFDDARDARRQPADARAGAVDRRESTAETRSTRRVLMVLTSHERLGETGRRTGYYLSEVTHAAKVFRDAGYSIDYASPQGGAAPMDGVKRSDATNAEYLDDQDFMAKVSSTKSPGRLSPDDYDVVYFAGGHGTMWDFPENADLQRITRMVYEAGGIVAAVCQGAAGLVNVRLSDGKHLVDGHELTSFTNDEESAVGLTGVVPFALESALRKAGGHFREAPSFERHVVISERLVTGQNPASATGVAQAVVAIAGGPPPATTP